jgi:Domain of unknown function (DUF4908)
MCADAPLYTPLRRNTATKQRLRQWLVGFGLGLALAASPNAYAQSQSQSSASSTSSYYNLFPDVNAATPQAIAFSTDARNLRFVLDRSQPRIVLLRFEGEDEIWALTSHWGPRGDEFLRNDVGDVMVRITSLGGVTIFGPLGSNGGPASSVGRARTISPPTRSESTLQLTVERAIGWFRRFGHRSIRVEAAGGLAPSLVYEALQRTAQGMSLAPRGFFGQPQRRVKLVRVERAAGRPSVTWERNTLTVGVVPGAGYAGRPSSAAVLTALTRQDRANTQSKAP